MIDKTTRCQGINGQEKMKNQKTILAFHIGRGGRYHNSGFLSFIGKKNIGEFTSDLFAGYENQGEFSARYGWDSCDDGDCILDCLSNRDLDRLEKAFGITEKMLGEYGYSDNNGNFIISQTDVDSLIGRINLDNEYDTTYTKDIEDLTGEEIYAIEQSGDFDRDEILNALKELGTYEFPIEEKEEGQD